jgi:hypothetical protein
MPLIEHFKQGFLLEKPPAWHRNEERRARGLWPVHNPAAELEGWERELAWTEILLLTGALDASFSYLARGWGRDKGFHMELSQFICKRVCEERQPDQAKNDGYYIDADIWDDDAVFGDADYNEALAADLMMFDDETSSAGGKHKHARKSSFMSSQSFTFREEDGDFNDHFDCSSSAEDISDESYSYTHDEDEVVPRLCSPCYSGVHV